MPTVSLEESSFSLRLAAFQRRHHDLRFVAGPREGAEIVARLHAISESVGRYEHGFSLAVIHSKSLHDNILEFVLGLRKLGQANREPKQYGREASIIASKAREFHDYLSARSRALGFSPPDQWQRGISRLSREAASPAGDARSEEAIQVIATIIREQIEHFYTIVAIELPRDARILAEEAFIRQSEAESAARVRQQEELLRERELKLSEQLRQEERAIYDLTREAEVRMSESVAAQRSRAADAGRLFEDAGIRCWFRPNPDVQVGATIEPLPLATDVRGEVHGFTARLDGQDRISDGDEVLYRIPLEASVIWDPDFATVIAATVEADAPSSVASIGIGLGDDMGLAYERRGPFENGETHICGAWRFTTPPTNPYLQLCVSLNRTNQPLEISFTRLFAGQGYDPYRFNPLFRPMSPPEHAEREHLILDAFERKAREACKTDRYLAAQAFVKPFLITRLGSMSFPMLVGSANSVFWYAEKPDHGLECFDEWRCIEDGDVTIDCGAHAGQMSTYFALRSGPRGRVVSVDPFAQNCLQVEAQAALNRVSDRVRVVQAGIGRERGKARVSILAQMTTATESSMHDDYTEIDLVPLDDFVAEAPTFVKLDIEGAEVDALKGGQELLRSCRPRLFIEVHTTLIWQFGYSLADFFDQIPLDIYHVQLAVDGESTGWMAYEGGMADRITQPLLVLARPRSG